MAGMGCERNGERQRRKMSGCQGKSGRVSKRKSGRVSGSGRMCVLECVYECEFCRPLRDDKC